MKWNRPISAAGRWIQGTFLLSIACWSGASIAQAPLLSETRNIATDRVDGGVPEGRQRSADSILRLAANQRVVISVESSAFDPLVQVRRRGDDKVLAEDDDGGEGLNARLYFTAGEGGEYEIRVSSYFPTESGEYRLTVLPAAEVVAAATQPVSTRMMRWRVYRGALADTDPQGPDGRFDDFRLRLRAGQEVVVLLDSVESSFDPVVQVFSPRSSEGEPLASNDDRNDGLGSLLIFTAADSEDFVIRVTSFDAGGRGSYVLRVGDTVAVAE